MGIGVYMFNREEFTLFDKFTDNPTTKEQYLKFKKAIKGSTWNCHAMYIAYYIFKHRIDNNELEKYLDEVVIPNCKKGLYKGKIFSRKGFCGYSGNKYGEKELKSDIRFFYNQYADEEQYIKWCKNIKKY